MAINSLDDLVSGQLGQFWNSPTNNPPISDVYSRQDMLRAYQEKLSQQAGAMPAQRPLPTEEQLSSYLAHPLLQYSLQDLYNYWQAKFGRAPVQVSVDRTAYFNASHPDFDIWFIYGALRPYNCFRKIEHPSEDYYVLRQDDELAFIEKFGKSTWK